jgi:putative FmdB family regulatory protein
MPLYEYECTACGERTEAIQAFSDPPLTICPVCGGTLRKLLSTPAFQFKGTGWYVTDYGKSGAKESDREKAGEKPGDTSKGEDGGGSGKSDATGASAGEGGGKTGDGGAASPPASGSAPPAPSKKKNRGRK